MSFYVGKLKSGNWRLMEQTYVNRKPKHTTVPKSAYPNLGVNPEWDIQTAKTRIQQLNRRKSLERKEQHKIVAIANTVETIEAVRSVYLPNDLVQAFHQKLKDKFFGDLQQRRAFSHWKCVIDVIQKLKLDPTEYADNKERIYKELLSRKFSYDYSRRIIYMLNLWGYFVGKHRKQPFEPIPKTDSHMVNKIEEAYQDSDDYRGESDPLTFELLENAKRKLKPEHYNWLYLSLWFGLRPSEVDGLKKAALYKVVYNGKRKFNVLHVYQSKLTRLKKAKRWKQIPVFLPEQAAALKIITEQSFTRPTLKALNHVFMAGHYTTYMGRKGFVALMKSYGAGVEDVSRWMGHQDIRITWATYYREDQDEVAFNPSLRDAGRKAS